MCLQIEIADKNKKVIGMHVSNKLCAKGDQDFFEVSAVDPKNYCS